MTITIYSKPACVQCTATYRALDNEGLDYTIVDITRDLDAHDYVRGLGYLQAPVVVAGDDHWAGSGPTASRRSRQPDGYRSRTPDDGSVDGGGPHRPDDCSARGARCRGRTCSKIRMVSVEATAGCALRWSRTKRLSSSLLAVATWMR